MKMAGFKAGRLELPDHYEQTSIASPRDLVNDVELRVLEGRLRILEGHRQLSQFQWKQFEEMLSTQPSPRALRSPREAPNAHDHLCHPIQACCLLGSHRGSTEKRSPRTASVERFHEELRQLKTDSGRKLENSGTFSSKQAGCQTVPLVSVRSLPSCPTSSDTAPTWNVGEIPATCCPSTTSLHFSLSSRATRSCLVSPCKQPEIKGKPRPGFKTHLRVMVPGWQGSPASSPATAFGQATSPSVTASLYGPSSLSPNAVAGRRKGGRSHRRRSCALKDAWQ